MLVGELVRRRLWGRSLWGLLAAVGVMFLAAYFWRRAFLIGFTASKAVGTPYYAEYLARGRYEELLWTIITLVLLVASAILLGVGVEPKTRLDRLLERLDLYDVRHERWIGPLRNFFGRLVLLAIIVYIISFLSLEFIFPWRQI